MSSQGWAHKWFWSVREGEKKKILNRILKKKAKYWSHKKPVYINFLSSLLKCVLFLWNKDMFNRQRMIAASNVRYLWKRVSTLGPMSINHRGNFKEFRKRILSLCNIWNIVRKFRFEKKWNVEKVILKQPFWHIGWWPFRRRFVKSNLHNIKCELVNGKHFKQTLKKNHNYAAYR